jgi:hypothetical protein
VTKLSLSKLSEIWGGFLLLAALTTPALGQQKTGQEEPSAEELAKKTQNPVADLISVPLQNNWNFGAGFDHSKTIYVLNIQPVIPINLSEKWNLISRIVMPAINQPSLFPTLGGAVPSTTGTGFGDFNPTFCLSPAKPGHLIWGLGPTFTLPTATDRDLGSGKWSMGPAGVALTIGRPSDREAADQYATRGVRQCVQAGVRPGVAVAISDSVLVSEMKVVSGKWKDWCQVLVSGVRFQKSGVMNSDTRNQGG